MLLENVKNILTVGKERGEVLNYIKNKISQTGYVLLLNDNKLPFVFSPHEFGVPQQRERVYFICIRKDIYDNNSKINIQELCEEEKNNDYDFTSFLDKEIDDKYKIEPVLENVLEKWDEIVNHIDVAEKLSPTILINDYYKNYTDEEFNELQPWRKDYMTKNKPLIEKYKNKFDSWYEENVELLNTREIYGKLEWQTGPKKENDSIFNHFIQIRQSGIRVKKSHYFPTLVAISQIPIYGKERRYLTPQECARLQSFPVDELDENNEKIYKLHNNDKQSYKQMGNAVNVKIVKMIANIILNNYGSSINNI